MEKQFNRDDRLMRKLLNEAGVERPSADFKSRIMGKIEARNAEIKPYEPLISKSAWAVLTGIMIASMAALYFMHSDISFSYELNFDFLNSMKLPTIDLSRNMQYAIAFIGLFLLQVPFLKRFIDRKYRF